MLPFENVSDTDVGEAQVQRFTTAVSALSMFLRNGIGFVVVMILFSRQGLPVSTCLHFGVKVNGIRCK